MRYFFLNRKRKELACGLESDTPLLNHEEEVKGLLKITFDRKAVSDVHLVVYRIANTGSVSILDADWIRPLSVTFGPDSKILTASVIFAKPATLKPAVSHDGNCLSALPVLLNRGDTFDIRVIVMKPVPCPAVDGRIVDIPHLLDSHEAKIRQENRDKLKVASIATFLAYLGAAAILVPLFARDPQVMDAFAPISILLALLLITLVPFFAFGLMYATWKKIPKAAT